MGLSDKIIDGSIRISLGKLSDEENIEMAANIISEIAHNELKRVGLI